MRRTVLDRRAVLAGLASLPLAVPPAARAEADAAALSFRSIAVDASPLARFGGGGTAAALTPILQAQLRRVFADRLRPGDLRAPSLVARITSLSMPSYVGYEDVDGFGPKDNIEGDGLVVAGRQTLSSTHILTSLSPSYSGAYNTPGIDRLRLDSIAYQFAYWLRREMNL